MLPDTFFFTPFKNTDADAGMIYTATRVSNSEFLISWNDAQFGSGAEHYGSVEVGYLLGMFGGPRLWIMLPITH